MPHAFVQMSTPLEETLRALAESLSALPPVLKVTTKAQSEDISSDGEEDARPQQEQPAQDRWALLFPSLVGVVRCDVRRRMQCPRPRIDGHAHPLNTCSNDISSITESLSSKPESSSRRCLLCCTHSKYTSRHPSFPLWRSHCLHVLHSFPLQSTASTLTLIWRNEATTDGALDGWKR